MRRKWRKR